MINKLVLTDEDTFSTLFEKVSNTHAQLFPDATLESQCAKFEEEFEEFKNAGTDEEICAEWADCFIVAAGIYRFSKHLGEHIAKSMIEVPDKQMFAEAIVNKMNKNIERQWNNTNGYYKHANLN